MTSPDRIVRAGLAALAWGMATLTRADGPIAEFPIEFEKNLPIASVVVKGVPVLFVLDSAADGSVIDAARAAELGIAPTDSALASGSGGVSTVGLARGVRLGLAGQEILPDFTILTGLGNLGMQKPVHGILGFPLFGKYVVEIDYCTQRVRLFDPGGFEPAVGAEVLRVWKTDGPTVRGRLSLTGAEQIQADFQLDTGSSHVLTVSRAFVAKHDMLHRLTGLVPGETQGLGGGSSDLVGRVALVGVGRESIDEPEVRFSTRKEGSLDAPRYDANLGNGFLSRFVVTFDLPGGRLVLSRPCPLRP